MIGMKSDTYQRVNISLPSRTLRRIDRVAEQGNRSRLINVAINFYIAERTRQQLRKALQAGAIERAERDRGIAVELFDLNSAWEK